MTASLAISSGERFSISTSTANNRFDSSRLLTAICISLLLSSNAIVFPGNCVNHHEFLCPDRLPYAVCRKHITGNEVPFSCYPFNRCMPHYLQKLPWFIKPPFVILRPVPDRRRILPHLSACESIDCFDDRINVVIFAGRNIPADKVIRQTTMRKQNIIDPVKISLAGC